MSTTTTNQKKKRGRPKGTKQIDKTAILEMAIQEFANRGFDGARQRDIALAAGITNSLMNYHFDGKEDLWKQAVTNLGEKLKKRLTEVQSYFKDLEGLAALKAYSRQFIYFSAEHPEFYKVVFHEMCTKTERAKWLIETILAPLHQLTESENNASIDGKLVFRGYPIANLFSILIGAANVFFIHSFQMENMYAIHPFDKKEIEQHADIVIELVFAKFEKGESQ